MSNRPNYRRRRPGRRVLEHTATELARVEGCQCQPDVNPEWLADHVVVAHVHHDPWCPLLLAKQASTN